jgi:hypothetical protein
MPDAHESRRADAIFQVSGGQQYSLALRVRHGPGTKMVMVQEITDVGDADACWLKDE